MRIFKVYLKKSIIKSLFPPFSPSLCSLPISLVIIILHFIYQINTELLCRKNIIINLIIFRSSYSEANKFSENRFSRTDFQKQIFESRFCSFSEYSISYSDNFRPKEIKIPNSYLKRKSHNELLRLLTIFDLKSRSF